MLLAGMSFTMEFDLTVDDPSLQFEPTPPATSSVTAPDAARDRASSASGAPGMAAASVAGRVGANAGTSDDKTDERDRGGGGPGPEDISGTCVHSHVYLHMAL